MAKTRTYCDNSYKKSFRLLFCTDYFKKLKKSASNIILVLKYCVILEMNVFAKLNSIIYLNRTNLKKTRDRFQLAFMKCKREKFKI